MKAFHNNWIWLWPQLRYVNKMHAVLQKVWGRHDVGLLPHGDSLRWEVGDMNIQWEVSLAGIVFKRPWVGGNLRLPWPQPYSCNTQECNMCNTSLWGVACGARAQGLKIKHVMFSEGRSGLQHRTQTLKLFSLGLRLMMMLNVSYGSSVPLWMLLVMSCWYWFGSSHTRNVLLSPRSLGFGSGPASERWGGQLSSQA